jgi:hypothetical protein
LARWSPYLAGFSLAADLEELVGEMVEPFMHTIHFKCLDCGQVGMGLRLQGKEAHGLSNGFHVETRDDDQVIVCKCGGIAFPPAPSA